MFVGLLILQWIRGGEEERRKVGAVEETRRGGEEEVRCGSDKREEGRRGEERGG